MPHWERMAKQRVSRFSFVGATRSALDVLMFATARLPRAQLRRKQVHIVRDVPYRSGGHRAHLLDVIRDVDDNRIQPALLYVHGGGFAVCSKETHEVFAHAYARMGFTVFVINYRLMPEHRYPAGFSDACDALEWVCANAADYGADASRLVIAGESAGGNIALGLTAAACYQTEDPNGQRIYALNPKIAACVPACGVLDVSGLSRLWRDEAPSFEMSVTKRILLALERDYLPRPSFQNRPPLFADPLRLIESRAPDRPLPPIFAFCGTNDVLYPDTRRLGRALTRHGVEHRTILYEGVGHAFHAMIWKPIARRSWADQRVFLSEVVPQGEQLHDVPVNEGDWLHPDPEATTEFQHGSVPGL